MSHIGTLSALLLPSPGQAGSGCHWSSPPEQTGRPAGADTRRPGPWLEIRRTPQALEDELGPGWTSVAGPAPPSGHPADYSVQIPTGQLTSSAERCPLKPSRGSRTFHTRWVTFEKHLQLVDYSLNTKQGSGVRRENFFPRVTEGEDGCFWVEPPPKNAAFICYFPERSSSGLDAGSFGEPPQRLVFVAMAKDYCGTCWNLFSLTAHLR